MDEPLSNLDAKLRVQMRTVIKKLQRRLGITTIYVTHDQEEALAISDRIAVMKDGHHIMQIGTPNEIYAKPQNPYVTGFIGVSNFLDRDVINGMYDLVAELKDSGCGIYLLSNASVRQHDYWPRIPASKFFDGKLISADVKVIKPQPEIYRLCLEKFNLNAGECFFIDDAPANSEGALCCGISGAVFHGDVSLLRSQLRAAGGTVHESL